MPLTESFTLPVSLRDHDLEFRDDFRPSRGSEIGVTVVLIASTPALHAPPVALQGRKPIAKG